MSKLRAMPLVSLLTLSVVVAGCGSGGDGGMSADAVAAYEEGGEALARRAGRADADAAVAAFERAVELAPEYAAAWSGLSQARMWLEFNQGVPDQLAGAEAAADRAVELAPEAMESHLAQGYIDYWGHRDLDAALVHFEAAAAVAPDNAEVAGGVGNIYRRKGQLDEAIEAYERRVAIDPSMGLAWVTLAQTYNAMGRYADVHEVGDQLLSNGDGRGHIWRFWGSFHSGDTASAWEEIPEIQEAQGRAGEPGYFAFLQTLVRRDPAAADALVDEIGTDDLGTGLRNLMASHFEMTDQVEARRDAFDAWIAEVESGLVEAPANPQARYGQAVRLGALAYLEALRGNADVSMAHARTVVELDPLSVDAWGGAGAMNDVTAAHLILGHVDPGLSGLETLTEQRRGPSVAWMELLPWWDDLRDNERFRGIIEERRSIERPLG